MNKVMVEWFHLDVNGETCDRCSGTGEELRAIVEKLNEECNGRGVSVELRETLLGPLEIEKSNLIEVDGRPIENVLKGASTSLSNCETCGELVGEHTSCRTVVQFGVVYETVPQRLVRDAVCRSAECC